MTVLGHTDEWKGTPVCLLRHSAFDYSTRSSDTRHDHTAGVSSWGEFVSSNRFKSDQSALGILYFSYPLRTILTTRSSPTSRKVLAVSDERLDHN